VKKYSTLFVELGDRSYPIFIGDGLMQLSKLLTSHIHGQQVLVVTNETVAPLYLEDLLENLSAYSVETVVLPDGEIYKNIEQLNTIFNALLTKKYNRTATLVALGGGVVGDMTGFAAACYQRGVNFLQIPTTLLAQVDSSVGGKTAVNHKLGKNMIGAFYQPQCVIIDTSLLSTLPDRQFKSGLAEVVKYGLISDPDFFDWIEKNITKLLERDPAALCFAIEKSCANKAKIVARDERENDVRATLNLGHTFGHAIETFYSYEGWLHGEAVAVGMVMAAELSEHMGWIQKNDVNRIKKLLVLFGLPICPPKEISSKVFLELMSVDKKVLDGSLRLVLLQSIGEAVVASDINQDILMKVI
jgi:3-dehydroquinate synthase